MDVTFVAAPTLSVVKFLLVIFAVQAMLLYAVFRTSADPGTGLRRLLAAVAAFALVMAVTAFLAEAGILRADPRRAVALFGAINLGVLVLAFTRPGAAMAAAVAPVYWVLFHGFRLPLEMVLHTWGEAGTVPVQMTWAGQNYDVVAGLTALALGALWMFRPGQKWAGYAAHVVGLLLLANVARIALFSLPTSFKAFEGDPLLVPFHVPYVWIVPFAVGAALFGHVVGLRAMKR